MSFGSAACARFVSLCLYARVFLSSEAYIGFVRICWYLCAYILWVLLEESQGLLRVSAWVSPAFVGFGRPVRGVFGFLGVFRATQVFRSCFRVA